MGKMVVYNCVSYDSMRHLCDELGFNYSTFINYKLKRKASISDTIYYMCNIRKKKERKIEEKYSEKTETSFINKMTLQYNKAFKRRTA